MYHSFSSMYFDLDTMCKVCKIDIKTVQQTSWQKGCYHLMEQYFARSLNMLLRYQHYLDHKLILQCDTSAVMPYKSCPVLPHFLSSPRPWLHPATRC